MNTSDSESNTNAKRELKYCQECNYTEVQYLLNNNWTQVALMPKGKYLYSLSKLPEGLKSTIRFANIRHEDAVKIQNCIDFLIEKKCGVRL